MYVWKTDLNKTCIAFKMVLLAVYKKLNYFDIV